jgi:hypothetical protein
MDKIKSMAISAFFIILFVAFVPILNQRVVSPDGRNTTAYNVTDPLTTSIVELSPVVVLVLAVAFILAVVRGFN